MIPISRMARICHPGVLKNFEWPNDLPEFGRYNLVYGWNGSGKTIISRMFRALEMHISPPNCEVSFTINKRDVSETEFPQQTVHIRVFNRDFIRESVFPVAGGDIPPIFVIGKESVEKQKEVAQQKASLIEVQNKLNTGLLNLQNAERKLDTFCIDQAKVIKDTLRSSGTNPYNNYDKGDFKCRAEEMIKAGDQESYTLDSKERTTLLSQHQASPKATLDELIYKLPDLEALEKTVGDLLSRTVVSTAIQSLKDDPTLSLWVHTGLGIHQQRQSKKCLFCEQPMPKNRLAALESHFSTEYEDLLQNVDTQIAVLQAAINEAKDVAIPKAVELYDDLSSDFQLAVEALHVERRTVIDVLKKLLKNLEGKKDRFFERIVLDADIPKLNTNVVDNLNAVITNHNKACDSFQSRVESARQKLEANALASNLDEFNERLNAIQVAEREITEAKNEIEQLKKNIIEIEREIVEHRQPAEELNEDLSKYLGHNELRLDIKDTGYAITRNGIRATDLSEGEMTAIALLYFLKSLKDKNFDLSNGVVVLDDPVSSLDANSLFFAFGFIRERTENAAQLFILTHNFALLRQVRNWFHHLKGQRKKDVSQRPARFYMLDCVRDGAQRCSNIRPLDPLLEQYESEYHYLFARIYRAATPSSTRALEGSYIFPNMARRLVETFLAFRQPHVSGELWQKLKDVKFDAEKKLRILRFVHTYSHSNAIGEMEHDSSLLGETDSVLKDLLELIKEQDREHFEAMVRLIESSTDEGDD